jgi:large subunit ribosomal protein L25
MQEIKIAAEKRTQTGKNENNRLRMTGKIPVNIISNGQSVLASISSKEFEHIVQEGIRPASLIDIDLEGSSSKVFIKEIQRTPGVNTIRHVDFYKVQPGKKIIVKVGITTTGTPKGVKAGGRFEHVIHEIKVKSTPEDLVDILTIDVTDIEVGQVIKVKELKVPASWEILTEPNLIVTSVKITKAMLAQERAAKEAEAAAAAGKKGKGKK